MKKIILVILISSKLFSGFCFVLGSCEGPIEKKNKKARYKINKMFQNTFDEINSTKPKYTQLIKELDKNIKQLNLILKNETLVNDYLHKILFEVKKEKKIKFERNTHHEK